MGGGYGNDGKPDPRMDVQHFLACSDDGTDATPPNGTCIDSAFDGVPEFDQTSDDIQPVRTGCATESGIWDLVGNAAEWQDAYPSSTIVEPDVRGGSYQDDVPICETVVTPDFTTVAPWIGFRCCVE
jgi:hypothetical protein